MFKTCMTIVATLAVSGFANAQWEKDIQWPTDNGGNGHWYRLASQDSGIDWESARQAAEDQGGHLVTCTSAEEDDFVRDNLVECTTDGVPNKAAWMGGRKVNGNWTWITNETWSFENWAANDPNSSDPDAVLNFHPTQSDNCGWADISPGDLWNYYVIEFSADCNDDGIVDHGQILDGTLTDADANGVPDACELEGISDPVQWSVSAGGNGHWYAFVQTSSPSCWETDRAMAEGMGGYLATITSASENDFIAQLVGPTYPISAAGCIGGYQDLTDPDYSEPSGAWKWVTGEPFQYTNWQGGEPGCCGPDENWLDFNTGNSGWRDRVNCLPNAETTSEWAIVEWSADCNGDDIVDYGQILNGELTDCNDNGIPDICELDEFKMGACCLGGNCVVTTANNCFDAQGAYAGDDISCEDANCPTACTGDIDGDGQIGIVDLLVIIDRWGICP